MLASTNFVLYYSFGVILASEKMDFSSSIEQTHNTDQMFRILLPEYILRTDVIYLIVYAERIQIAALLVAKHMPLKLREMHVDLRACFISCIYGLSPSLISYICSYEF